MSDEQQQAAAGKSLFFGLLTKEGDTPHGPHVGVDVGGDVEVLDVVVVAGPLGVLEERARKRLAVSHRVFEDGHKPDFEDRDYCLASHLWQQINFPFYLVNEILK